MSTVFLDSRENTSAVVSDSYSFKVAAHPTSMCGSNTITDTASSSVALLSLRVLALSNTTKHKAAETIDLDAATGDGDKAVNLAMGNLMFRF